MTARVGFLREAGLTAVPLHPSSPKLSATDPTASRNEGNSGSHPIPNNFPLLTRLCVQPRFRSGSRGPLGGRGLPKILLSSS